MRLPTYRKHSSGQARVTIAGKDHMLGPYGSKESKKLFDRLLGEYIAGGRSRTYGKPADDISIIEVMAAYQKHIKVYYQGSKATIDHIKVSIRPLDVLYDSLPAKDFGVNQFENVRHYIMEGKNRGPDSNATGKPSRGYVNDSMKRVKRMFKWAVSKGLIEPSVFQRIETIESLKRGRTTAPERAPVLPIDEETVTKTIEALPKIVGDMVRVHLLIGCRSGELCALKAGMIDRTKDIWVAKLDQHKTAYRGKERFLYIGEEAQEILKPYLLRGDDSYLFSPAESERKRREEAHANRVTPASCGNSPGSRPRRKRKHPIRNYYTVSSYRRCITRACKENGLPHWFPGRLRHTFATESRKVNGIEITSILLGHSDVETTKIYAERDHEDAMKALRGNSKAKPRKRNSAS